MKFINMFFSTVGICLDESSIIVIEHLHYQLLVHFYLILWLYRLAQRYFGFMFAIKAFSSLKFLLNKCLNLELSLKKGQSSQETLLIFKFEPEFMVKF